jgi:hypothetical protein
MVVLIESSFWFRRAADARQGEHGAYGGRIADGECACRA